MVALSVFLASAAGADKPEASYLVFVTEFIRELATMERLRSEAQQELAGKPTEVFSLAIHSCTLTQLELRSQISMLKGMRLKAPYDELTKNLTYIYQQKIALHQRMIEISTAFVGTPKPNVDYDELAAQMRKIRAALDFLDRTIFESTSLVFATLVDMRADSKNHVSHLIITKAERTKLLDDLASRFGSKLDQKGDQKFMVAAATVLSDYLLKDFKCSDDPWE